MCCIQYACVLKLKIMSVVCVIKILGVIVVLYDDAGGKRQNVRTALTLFPALLLLSWHSIKKNIQ